MIRNSAVLTLDGSHGEGGGQILRTALALAALTGKAVRIDNIRARRAKPGLAAQHLTAVRSLAYVCRAEVSGADLGSQCLTFTPRSRPIAGAYAFDVATARPGGSAGSALLVFQAMLLPLALADGPSTVTIDGGTHLPHSPFVEYVATIWLPVLARAGITADVHTLRTGWYPIGGGRIRASIQAAGGDARRIRPLSLVDRGALRGVRGRAVTANLPDHIAGRMAARAEALLAERGIEAHIERACETAPCPGAGLFIAAEFEHGLGGACALGRRGKPAEQVASEAVESLLGYMDSGAVLDAHMGDQVLLPAAFASASFRFTVERVTSHLTTNAWVIEQFGCARIDISRGGNDTALVIVEPLCRAGDGGPERR
jgi:RNA 3'-terminal phosphate cyclase (ATP)